MKKIITNRYKTLIAQKQKPEEVISDLLGLNEPEPFKIENLTFDEFLDMYKAFMVGKKCNTRNGPITITTQLMSQLCSRYPDFQRQAEQDVAQTSLNDFEKLLHQNPNPNKFEEEPY
jgi:hypothetical protein